MFVDRILAITALLIGLASILLRLGGRFGWF